MKEFKGVVGEIVRFIDRNIDQCDRLHLAIKENERLQEFLTPYINQGMVVLNISPMATNHTLTYEDEGLWFRASFRGVRQEVFVMWCDIIGFTGYVDHEVWIAMSVLPFGVTVNYPETKDQLQVKPVQVKEETKRPKLTIVKND